MVHPNNVARWWRRPWKAPPMRRASRWRWPVHCWSTSQRPMMDSIHCWMLDQWGTNGEPRVGLGKTVNISSIYLYLWWKVEHMLVSVASWVKVGFDVFLYHEFGDDCMLTKWLRYGTVSSPKAAMFGDKSQWPSQNMLTLIGSSWKSSMYWCVTVQATCCMGYQTDVIIVLQLTTTEGTDFNLLGTNHL